ncbi:heavy-metal-associated domain-containing protein [Sporichthya polymorpha]|uniref:heavy-metal-associated domain-containing protein n=1 Tax=Sporichthya polymorpha TaxID=35751 RepID=UPI0003754814|nr:heavy-metal-associated domain-containing protein [Sporichthya polymorpha]
MITSTFTVRGMTCGHCVSSVRSEVEALPGVSRVHLDLSTGRLEVTGSQAFLTADIRAAVAEAGYELDEAA